MAEDENYRVARKDVEHYVACKIMEMQRAYLSDSCKASASARLAALRAAIAKAPWESSNVWAIEFEGMPESLEGRGEEPSWAEWAVHASMTLYAVHQQSQDMPMYKVGRDYGIGSAVRRMVAKNPEKYANLKDGEMPRRFVAFATADSLSETLHYARQLVQQLRATAVPLDYGLLAGQLYDLQNPYRRDSVRIAWGRGYSSGLKSDNTAKKETNDQ